MALFSYRRLNPLEDLVRRALHPLLKEWLEKYFLTLLRPSLLAKFRSLQRN
ncbi:MAG: DUF2497 domain-containing protein [Holosporales bacterium]|nr:DUF2497 domain-containing protein [Holosporales bacterium]